MSEVDPDFYAAYSYAAALGGSYGNWGQTLLGNNVQMSIPSDRA